MFGLAGIEHIGITVPDLEQALSFFVDVLGCEEFFPLGPFRDDGNWMADHLNVHPRAEIRSIRFVRCRNGPNIELFEYSAPGQRTDPPRNSDIGGHHLALYVDDIAAAVRHLETHDVKVMGAPTIRSTGPNAGQTWVYFVSPWGLHFELVSYPAGRGYERDWKSRLWHPKFPAA